MTEVDVFKSNAKEIDPAWIVGRGGPPHQKKKTIVIFSNTAIKYSLALIIIT